MGKSKEAKRIAFKDIKGLRIELTWITNLPSPLFAKEGCCSSLWYVFPAEGRQREVRRDFIIQWSYYYTVNKVNSGFNDSMI
jgi:hypothetical protein